VTIVLFDVIIKFWRESLTIRRRVMANNDVSKWHPSAI